VQKAAREPAIPESNWATQAFDLLKELPTKKKK
jgi:hypothetical protein